MEIGQCFSFRHMTPPHAIKEEIVTTSRSQDEVRICDDRATMNMSSPGPSHAMPQSSPPPCSSALRIPTVSLPLSPFVGYPIGPPIAHSTQFYPRVRGAGYRGCSSEASVSTVLYFYVGIANALAERMWQV